MTVCNYCGQEMLEAGGCFRHYYVDREGNEFEATPEHFDEPSGRCHDCNAVHGAYHHPGCDVERCPKCGGQAISCECDLPEVSIEVPG